MKNIRILAPARSKSLFALKCAVIVLSFILLAVGFKISTLSTSAQTTASSSAGTTATSGNVCKTDNADVVLILDTSNSMQGSKLASAKKAAIDLVNILGKNDKMRVGVASFDNHGRLNQGLSATESTVISSINNMKTGGKNGTCLECALRQKGKSDVQTAFTNAGDNGNKRHVIILTDGKINFYQKPDGTSQGQPNDKSEEKKARDQALAAITDISNNQKATFWTIQYGSQDNKSWLENDIVAKHDGKGKYYYAPTLDNVDEIYRAIANELSGGTLTAFVYDDLNKNEKFDTGEPALANVDVTMTDASGSKTQKTGPDGKTSFIQLCATAYKLKVTPPGSYQPSPPNSNERDVTIPLGGTKEEPFGFTQKSDITFTYNFVLHGLGIAGDNVVPRPAPCANREASAENTATTGNSTNGCFSNQKPLHPTRDIKIDLLDDSGSVSASLNGKMTYEQSLGYFRGIGSISASLKEGAYTFKAHTSKYLKKKVIFTQTVKPGGEYVLPLTDLIAADVDNDNQLSILDYNLIAPCYKYPNVTNNTCDQAKIDEVDTDDNGVINEFDLNLFVRELSVRIGE